MEKIQIYFLSILFFKIVAFVILIYTLYQHLLLLNRPHSSIACVTPFVASLQEHVKLFDRFADLVFLVLATDRIGLFNVERVGWCDWLLVLWVV